MPVSDYLVYVPFAGVVVAAGGVGVAVRSRRLSRRSVLVTEAQEARRQPALQVTHLSSTCEVRPDSREYIFDLVLLNPSDSPTAVATAELWIDYIDGGASYTSKFPWKPAGTVDPGALTLPLNLGANEAASGSMRVVVPRDPGRRKSVDRARLVLFDVHQNMHVVTTELVQERIVSEPGQS